jgi:hypothetical protein
MSGKEKRGDNRDSSVATLNVKKKNNNNIKYIFINTHTHIQRSKNINYVNLRWKFNPSGAKIYFILACDGLLDSRNPTGVPHFYSM